MKGPNYPRFYYLHSQIYDTVLFFKNFDHSSYLKYLFKNVKFYVKHKLS
jgi:hypothetical protein